MIMARILKDVNGDIHSHLRNHVHLTNCIHVKNAIHKKRNVSNDESILRNISAFQRSRPLMDPSATPSLRLSPPGTSKGDENGKSVCNMPSESDDMKSRFCGRLSRIEDMGEEAETSIRGYNRGLNRGKRRKFCSTRRTRSPNKEVTQNKVPVVSATFAESIGGLKYHSETGEEEYDEQNLTRGSRIGCKPWSSIHQRGRSFRGELHPKFKSGDSILPGKDVVDSSSSVKCDEESLPLLVDESGSQQSNGTAERDTDYSGELGIYAENLLNHVMESDNVSEARTGDQSRIRRHHNRRHQILTQKYTPKTFKDIVGQNLVVQALSNSVAKRKVGLVYVFYGPHGTGKTSCARVFARALNCLSAGKTKPCGFCNFCKACDKGKTRNIKELGPVSKFDFEHIMDLLDNMEVSISRSQHKVFIFDDCDTMSTYSWSALSKVIARAPRRVVFILICSSLDVLPHVIISRCQKFLFTKLKEPDIIYALRSIATNEVLDIDDNALKIIASRSEGSLRDAEMTLEQLTLLGQKITVSLVQELVGLISDEKLVDLLDLALSADTVKTVKSLREIMESGIEPLVLMSQFARIITDVLAGACDLTKERSQRKFFQSRALSREQMEKLRQALKTLSGAEKQLRMSNDRPTWLIAALLQLALDQQYMLPNSSASTDLKRNPIIHGMRGRSEETRKSTQKQGNHTTDRRQETSSMNPEQSFSHPTDVNKLSDRRLSDIVYKDIEQIWSEVLEKLQVRGLKEFMHKEAKLVSLSFGKAPTAQLMFSSPQTKLKAERYGKHLLEAFESVLRSPLRVEFRCELKDSASQQIDEITYSDENKSVRYRDKHTPNEVRDPEITVFGDGESSCKKSTISSVTKGSNFGEQSRSTSLVKSKVTLAQVLRKAEGRTHRNNRSKHKAVSIAEELERKNLRLEPSTKSLFCCNTPRRKHWKFSHPKSRNRKPVTLMRFISCGKCLSSRSPR